MDDRVTAEDLALRVGVSGKQFRAWPREQARAGHPLLADHEHYGRWLFTPGDADITRFRRTGSEAAGLLLAAGVAAAT